MQENEGERGGKGRERKTGREECGRMTGRERERRGDREGEWESVQE